jgi:hypothetical protein
LRHYSTTPPARLWALVAVSLVVLLILAVNLWLTRKAKRRKARMESFASQMTRGPELRFGSGQ